MGNKQINDVELKSAFYMEPEEIVDFFKSKGLTPSFDWQEVYAEAHAKAFTVAKMTELDLLKDTKNLLEKSIKDGVSYSQFKKEATQLFEKKGWVGFKDVVDPNTGEKKVVELGTPRRIKKIFDCNINSAYSVGRFKQQLEEVDVAPYWQYMAIMDERTRAEHKAMHLKVFRADDIFWSQFYPPNGWGCRCFVRNLTKNEVQKQGLTVEKTERKFSTETIKVGNEEKEVPVFNVNDGGVEKHLVPDSGWETNLGVKAWGLDIQAWNKVKDMPEDIKYKFISEMASNPHRKDVVSHIIKETLRRNELRSRGIEATLNWFTPKIIDNLKQLGLEYKSPIITFEDRQVRHSLGNRKVKQQRLEKNQFTQIYDYIDNPDEIFIDMVEGTVNYVKFLPKEKIINECDCINIPVKINIDSKKRPTNYIGTTQRVKYSSVFLNKKRYKKVE